jgi:NADPH-dependent 2,4-dienoyl-CoA reductase/sulfur reductase-like enzyme
MAEAMVLRRLKVSLIDMLPEVMGTLDPDMGSLVSDEMRRAGVDLYLGEKLTEFEINGARLRAVVTDKRTISADLAIVGLGVKPNTGIAGAAGITLGVKNAIRVDSRMRTSVDGIWSAGDCVESLHLVSRKPFYAALGTVANKQGRIAGINLGGGNAKFPGIVGTAITKFKDLEIARTGVQESEARELGLDYVTTTINTHIKAGYYPETGKIAVKMLGENGSGRLLGAQIVGGPGSGKRIDTVATALHAGMTVTDVIDLDLAYAPPYSPVWDALHTAARQTVKRIR